MRAAMPRAARIDPRSAQAAGMLQERRHRWCEDHNMTHDEIYCGECSRSQGMPVYHLVNPDEIRD